MAAQISYRYPVMSPLETLPLIVLDMICEYLAHSEPGKRRCSLLNFALASKRCCELADRQRFETVRITVKDPTKLQRDLDTWNEILSIRRRARFVRRLEIRGFMQQPLEGQSETELLDDDESDSADSGPVYCGNATESLCEDVEYEYDDEEYDEDLPWERARRVAERYFLVMPPPSLPPRADEERAPDAMWVPLTQFLARLPAVKDLFYECIHQVPMCILSALHQNHPKCRLHIAKFELRSLVQLEFDQHDIEPGELALIKSPCLHSINVVLSDEAHDSIASYNQEAVLEMISGLSPGLRAVRMTMRSPYHGAFARPKTPWRGFLVSDGRTGQKPAKSQSRSKGQVQDLAIAGYSLSPGQITGLSQRTDFSQLRTLQLDLQSGLSIGDIQTLTKIAQVTGFKFLRALLISNRNPDFRWPEAPATDEVTALFLRSLPPLEAIRLTGLVLDQSFDAVISHHGHALRKLCFLTERKFGMPEEIPFFIITANQMERLAERSPNLEDVELVVPRTKGDEQELAIYRALSQMPRLKRLSLLLEFAPLAMLNVKILYQEARRNEFEEHVRECFINAAVDSDLALAIFRAVSAQSKRLQRFKVGLYEKSHLSTYLEIDEMLESLIATIGGSWTITHTGPEEPKIKKIRTPAFRPPSWLLGNDPFRDAMYKRIWRNIWQDSDPHSQDEETDEHTDEDTVDKDDEENWWSHWHSFPLEDNS